MRDEEFQLVTVASFTRPWEAHSVRTRLQAHGLRAFIEGEHGSFSHMMDAAGSIKVRVPAEESETAVEILRRHEPSHQTGPDSLNADRPTKHRRAAISILLVIVLVNVWMLIRALLS